MSNKQLNMWNLLLRKKTCSFHSILLKAVPAMPLQAVLGSPGHFALLCFMRWFSNMFSLNLAGKAVARVFFFQTKKNVIDANVSMVFNACGQTCPFGKLANGWCSQTI